MLFKKLTMLAVIFNICAISFPAVLPKPKNAMLYTEFDFVRTSKYLKKPVTGSGYIAMEGQDKFIFRQNSPVRIVVRKNGRKMTFQKEDAQPVEIDPKSGGDVMFLFDSDESINSRFDISAKRQDGRMLYSLVPKSDERIKSISVIAKGDRVEKIEINFANDSSLAYTFKNTVTGTAPGEKYFQ